MRLHQHTSVKRFGEMRQRARQNSRRDVIHIGAGCNQQPNNLNVATFQSTKYRGHSSFPTSVAEMRLHQHTSVKRFGEMRQRARQNSRRDSIRIGARCDQHRRYINVLLIYGNTQRGQ
jgi:hypothetical protein